ncbi:hypothetical protein Syun_005136 [Stephania yunnanensis]|uniref:RING-type domain-containing protein n=1 Tax=Stephania yunnanensis TaxID=152371 RepID=A0AAP0L8D4_9MAGN
MGSACCVAVRHRTVQNGTGNEAFHRAIRYSPSWSHRWDNRGRVASDDDRTTAGICRSSGSVTKIGRDIEFSCISDGGNPVENFQTPTPQVSPSDLSKGKHFHAEVKNLVESPAAVYSSVGSTTLVSKVDTLSSQSHPLPDVSTPSKHVYNSPAHPHFRKISDERIPELASPSTSIYPGRRSYPTLSFSNESGLSSRGGSSDIWSMLAFSELVSSSQRDRWSFDSKALDLAHVNVIGSNNDRLLGSPDVDTSICGVCSKLLTDASLWRDQKILGSNELSVVAILVCGHVYHAECLECMTPETETCDPPCPVCINEKQPSMVYQKTLKKEVDTRGRNRRSKSHVMDSYLGLESYNVDLKHQRKSRRADKSAKISYASSSSMKNSFTGPFLNRHFSLGSKYSKPIPGNDSLTELPGKKGFWLRYLP